MIIQVSDEQKAIKRGPPIESAGLSVSMCVSDYIDLLVMIMMMM